MGVLVDRVVVHHALTVISPVGFVWLLRHEHCTSAATQYTTHSDRDVPVRAFVASVQAPLTLFFVVLCVLSSQDHNTIIIWIEPDAGAKASTHIRRIVCSV